MRKIKLTLLSSILFSFVACQNEEQVTEQPIIEHEVAQPFDTLAYLECHNSDEIVYTGTKSYLQILNSNDFIETETIIDADYLKVDKVKTDFDSLFYILFSDTLYLSYLKFLRGRETPVNYLSHIEYTKNNAEIKSQEITNGYVHINEKDTTIGTDGACLAGIFEFKHKIPLSKLKNVEHHYFRGEKIEYG